MYCDLLMMTCYLLVVDLLGNSWDLEGTGIWRERERERELKGHLGAVAAERGAVG